MLNSFANQPVRDVGCHRVAAFRLEYSEKLLQATIDYEQ